MVREYNMASSLAMGQMGEILARSILRAKFPDSKFEDYREDMDWQQRGVDFYVEGLGYIEVKTDSHKPENMFIELSNKDGPGAIDRSSADWICVLYFKHNVMYLIPRSWLQFWMRENLASIDNANKRRLTSTVNNKRWTSDGMFVKLSRLTDEIPNIRRITWSDEEETMSGEVLET